MISEIRQILSFEGKSNAYQWIRRALTVLGLTSLVMVALIVVRIPGATIQVDMRPAGQLSMGRQAEAKRYTALAGHYMAIEEARQGAIFADTARWNAQAEHYARERVIDAETARLEGLAKYYLAREGISQRALEAYAARLTALAEYYKAQGE